jgi:hypothetical protein
MANSNEIVDFAQGQDYDDGQNYGDRHNSRCRIDVDQSGIFRTLPKTFENQIDAR